MIMTVEQKKLLLVSNEIEKNLKQTNLLYINSSLDGEIVLSFIKDLLIKKKISYFFPQTKKEFITEDLTKFDCIVFYNNINFILTRNSIIRIILKAQKFEYQDIQDELKKENILFLKNLLLVNDLKNDYKLKISDATSVTLNKNTKIIIINNPTTRFLNEKMFNFFVNNKLIFKSILEDIEIKNNLFFYKFKD